MTKPITTSDLWGWVSKLAVLLPIVLPIVFFWVTIWKDVDAMKADTKRLHDNVIYINTQIAKTNETMLEVQKDVTEILHKMNARITVLEARVDWNNSQIQVNQINKD